MLAESVVKLFVTAAYFLVLLLALPGNSLVVFILTRTQQQRVSVTNLFLLNLCFADLIQSLAIIPFNIVNDSWSKRWMLGWLPCKLLGFIQGTGVSLVAFTQVLISIDRFIVVFRPLRPRIKVRWAFSIIAAVWTVSLGSSSPLIYASTLQDNNTRCAESWSPGKYRLYTIIMLLVQFFLPVACMVVSYSMIVSKVWFKINPGIYSRQQMLQRTRYKEKLLKTVITISLLYTLAQLPRHVIFLCSMQASRMFWRNKQSLWLFVSWLSASSCCYNPLIYFWINPTYRRVLLRTFGCASRSSGPRMCTRSSLPQIQYDLVRINQARAQETILCSPTPSSPSHTPVK